MASFSFGAGNAAKLARLPLYVAGRLVTLVVPRTRDEWVFGCAVGIADGALALWEVAVADGTPAVWLTGSAREEADAAARGIPTVPKHSLPGLWRTARARVIVVTHGFGDVNRYAVSGAFVAQLWHGIPLKRIGLDSPETVRLPALAERVPGARRLVGALYRSAAGRIRLLPAASHLVRARLESAFGLPDAAVPVTGEPRADVLSRGTAPQRRSTARQALEAAAGPLGSARAVLYAPTWRDGAVDPAVPTAAEWETIAAVLDRQDAVLFTRSHHLGVGAYEPPTATDRVRALGSEVVADITPLLPGFDALITDYSSVAFDASLVPLPVLFFAPDVEEYAKRRGFYGRYADVAEGGWAAQWSQAAADLERVLEDDDVRAEALARARRLDARVHAFRDGGSAERVHRAILAGLGESARTAGTGEGRG